jgi:serine protease Do
MVAEAAIDSTVALEFFRNRRNMSANVLIERLNEARRPAVLASAQSPDAVAAAQGRVLGMTLAQITPQIRQRYGLTPQTRGLVVTAVDATSDAAGKVQPGDVIMEMQFEEVASLPQAQRQAERFGQNNRPVLIYLDRRGDVTFRSVRERRR